MRKKTNWSTDDIINIAPVNTNEENSEGGVWGGDKSSLISQQDREFGWSHFQNQNTDYDSKNSLKQGDFTRKSAHRSGKNFSMPSYVGKGLLIVAGCVIAAGLVIALIKNGSALFASIGAGIGGFFKVLMYIVIISLFLWILLLAIVGRFIPSSLKLYSLFLIFGLTILGRIFPELCAAVLTILIIVVAIVFLIKMMIN